MFKLPAAAVAAFFVTSSAIAQTSLDRQIAESTRDFFRKHAYPAFNEIRCGTRILEAVLALRMSKDFVSESALQNHELSRDGCLDDRSGFVEARKLSQGDRTVVAVDLGRVRYVHIRHFHESTATEFHREVYSGKGIPRALILDLRGNIGGNLDTALAVADTFSPMAGVTAVESVSRNNASIHEKTQKIGPLKDVRTVILVDGLCASSCEVVAGLLRHWDSRRLLVGTRTYGKGRFQWHTPISAKSPISLTLTVGELFIGGDRLYGRVHGRGLVPDVHVRHPKPQPVDVDPVIHLALRMLSQ